MIPSEPQIQSLKPDIVHADVSLFCRPERLLLIFLSVVGVSPPAVQRTRVSPLDPLPLVSLH